MQRVALPHLSFGMAMLLVLAWSTFGLAMDAAD